MYSWDNLKNWDYDLGVIKIRKPQNGQTYNPDNIGSYQDFAPLSHQSLWLFMIKMLLQDYGRAFFDIGELITDIPGN